MKKLIALAVVAVAGVVFANDGYDFTATLKTTVGKAGRDSTTTYNLGMAQDGTFWYNAPVAALPTNLTTKVINGITIPALVKDAKGYYVGDDSAKIPLLAAIYDQKSAGKWCETVKVLTPAQCYRVAGTRKINTVLWTDSCCGQKSFTNGLAIVSYDNGGVVTNDGVTALGQAFGAQELAKAKKIEIYGPALDLPVEAGNAVPATFNGWLAGQGTRDNVRATSISGNIVGTIDAPVCPNCCTAPTPALAFDCYHQAGTNILATAAYGTFRMKYNRNR